MASADSNTIQTRANPRFPSSSSCPTSLSTYTAARIKQIIDQEAEDNSTRQSWKSGRLQTHGNEPFEMIFGEPVDLDRTHSVNEGTDVYCDSFQQPTVNLQTPMERFCTMDPRNDPHAALSRIQMMQMGITPGDQTFASARTDHLFQLLDGTTETVNTENATAQRSSTRTCRPHSDRGMASDHPVSAERITIRRPRTI